MESKTQPDVYDIIVAGGGTAGGVLAARLSAADPTLSILILEAGPHTHEDLAHTQPARYLSHLRPGSTTVRFHTARKNDALGGREVVVPCGRCVGGGSSVNFAMYTRASVSDYDDWETVHGNAGWGSRDLIPLLRKCETYQVQPKLGTHGYDGPLQVSCGGVFTQVGRQFLDAARMYDPARNVTDDVNGLTACNEYGRWPKWIDETTGTRSDVAHRYLYPAVNAPGSNLQLRAGCSVVRVLFTEDRASGVEYLPGAGEPACFAHARRLVVLSAGTFGSPAILERSGIGAADGLRKLGISPRVDLPGVGENYHDHLLMVVPFHGTEDLETLDGIIRNDEAEMTRWNKQWEQDQTGLMAHNGLDAGIKIRPTAAELAALGPAFARRWEEYYASAPDKPVMIIAPISLYLGTSPHPPQHSYGVLYYSMHPAATGRVHITSADDPGAPSDFEPNYFAREEDVAVMKWGYKRARELGRRMPCYRGEFVPDHPAFDTESAARCEAQGRPVAPDAPDIVYSADNERVLDEHTRRTVATAWHALGTCAMRARDRDGVVDERLNVHGVQNLKIADMSVAPSNVASNTYSTAVVIGEKAALIIAEDLGISL